MTVTTVNTDMTVMTDMTVTVMTGVSYLCRGGNFVYTTGNYHL